MPNNQGFPDDMRDLLIRLDAHVAAGFESVNEKLDAQARRSDDQEDRIRNLEKTSQDRGALVERFIKLENIVALHTTRFNELDGMAKISTPILSRLWWPIVMLLAGLAMGVVGTNVVEDPAPTVVSQQKQ